MNRLTTVAALLAFGASACGTGDREETRKLSSPGGLATNAPHRHDSHARGAPSKVTAGKSLTVGVALNTFAAGAPALDRTIVTTTAAQLQHVYSGAAPEQTGVANGAIEPTRAAGLSGTVIDRDSGQPIANVTVSVVGEPTLGNTLSKADGTYRLVINGGKPATVELTVPGYLPARRKVTAEPLEYATVSKVALVHEPATGSFAAQTIAFSTGSGVRRAAGGPRLFRSDAVQDKDGSRRVSVFFPAATQSKVQLASGELQSASALTVSAVEYTTGPNGLAAMPADLPPTSAYTYAVELRVSQGGGAVFDPPVPVYVDNFINLTPGTTVPSGYYDRTRGQWVASPNGRVIKLLSVSAGQARLDVDGSGNAANSATLTALGITSEELTQLATTYAPNQTFWRVPVAHFSLFDFNLGFMPPSGAKAGKPGDDLDGDAPATCEVPGGSVIECQTQVLRENVPITGTPFSLAYRSDRVVGRKDRYTLRIPVTPHELPGPLQGVEVEITVAGRTFTQSFGASPDQIMSFTWDGKDAFGRLLQGIQPARVKIGNVYFAEYGNTPTFGTAADGTSTGTSTRVLAGLWGERTYAVGTWDAKGVGVGGWDLDVHHAYDPVAKVLNLADRVSGSSDRLGSIISTVAGNGTTRPEPNGTLATATGLFEVRDVAYGPDGLLYIGTISCIRRVLANGTIETYAGNCDSSGNSEGDGGPALSARLSLRQLAFGPDGALYFVESFTNKVRKIDTSANHIITTIAGTGASGFSGDGGPAVLAKLNGANGIAVGADGAIYVTDNERVRRIGPDRIIRTFAGKGIGSASGDDGPATDAFLNSPRAVAVAADGSVYIAGGGQVRRVATDGIIRLFAGGRFGTTLPGDGVPAIRADLHFPCDLALDGDGNVFISECERNVVRRVDVEGTISSVAGTSNIEGGFSGDLGPALAAKVRTLFWGGIAIGRDGELFIGDNGNSRVRKVGGALPGLGAADFVIPSRDGQELYVFNGDGKHLRTLDALVRTQRPLYEFQYVPETGELASVTDVDGNVTRVVRDATGKPTGIQSPFGQTTSVELDDNGYLKRIANPNNQAFNFSYFSGGLLATKTDPRNKVSEYQYDNLGRLTLDRDPPTAGGSQTLTRTELAAGWSVQRTTQLGRTNQYKVERLATQERLLTNLLPNGTSVTQRFSPNGQTTITSPDGTSVVETESPNPRFGMLAPLTTRVVRLPSGLTRTTSLSRQAQLSTPLDLLSLTSYSETSTINGRNSVATFNPSTLTSTISSPAARQSFLTLNSKARLASLGQNGVLPTSFGYDALGRLHTSTSDTRVTTLDYDKRGFLSTVKNALDQTSTLGVDDAGRITSLLHPDTQQTLLGYDATGKLNSVTPPGRTAHTLDHTAVNLLETYTPPAAGLPQPATSYVYNEDRQLLRMTRPDGLTLVNDYDNAGRLNIVTLPTGFINFGYHPTSGQLSTISGPYGQTIAFDYDGYLPRSVTASGSVSGSVAWTYDSDFRVATESVNGSSAVTFGYDSDNLLTSAGALNLTRDPSTGFVSGSTVASVNDTSTYDAHGAVATYAASSGANATPLYSFNVTERDNLGRITKKDETIVGDTTSYGYTYDNRGRLTHVRKNGSLSARYYYDANGNRTKGPYSPNVATYDAQDRLLTYGFNSYTYTAHGELFTKHAPEPEAQSFLDFAEEIGMWIGHGLIGVLPNQYSYDILGSLTRVELFDSTILAYVIDGQGRRVGKKRNGQLVQGFVYKDQLRIAAELNGSNGIVSQFVYGTKPTTPEYMLRGGVTYRIISDHLGSVRLVVNAATGEVVQQMDYDAFGLLKNDTNPGFQPFGFAGGLYDVDTELVRFGARDYDPRSGRWVSKDPILFGAGQENLYVYAGNDPINQVDPSGLVVPFAAAVLGSGAAGAVVGGIAYALSTPSACQSVGGWVGHVGGGFIAGAGIPFVAVGLGIGGLEGGAVAFLGGGGTGFTGDILKQATEGTGDVDFGRAAAHGVLNIAGATLTAASLATNAGRLGYLSPEAQAYLFGNLTAKVGGYFFDGVYNNRR